MPTLTQLSSNLTEIVIYAAIALVTLTGLCKCIYPLLRNATLLNRAVIKLEKSTAAGGAFLGQVAAQRVAAVFA